MTVAEVKTFISNRVEQLESIGGAGASVSDPYLYGAYNEAKMLEALLK